MSAATITPLGEGRFGVSGVLDFSTVAALLPQGLTAFADASRVELDLAGVTRANSAGLVLLLEWLDHARRRGQSLRLAHLPASLADIARISNCLTLLPVTD